MASQIAAVHDFLRFLENYLGEDLSVSTNLVARALVRADLLLDSWYEMTSGDAQIKYRTITIPLSQKAKVQIAVHLILAVVRFRQGRYTAAKRHVQKARYLADLTVRQLAKIREWFLEYDRSIPENDYDWSVLEEEPEPSPLESLSRLQYSKLHWSLIRLKAIAEFENDQRLWDIYQDIRQVLGMADERRVMT